MKIEEKDIEHVADLARIYISEDKKNHYLAQVNDVLGEIEKIIEVPLNETEMMISPWQMVNQYRRDEVGENLNREDQFFNVRHKEGNYIIVPKVLE